MIGVSKAAFTRRELRENKYLLQVRLRKGIALRALDLVVPKGTTHKARRSGFFLFVC